MDVSVFFRSLRMESRRFPMFRRLFAQRDGQTIGLAGTGSPKIQNLLSGGFAALPLQSSPQAAAQELTRCIRELGFLWRARQWMVADRAHRIPLYSRTYRNTESFGRTVQQLDVPFYLHPLVSIRAPTGLRRSSVVERVLDMGIRGGWTSNSRASPHGQRPVRTTIHSSSVILSAIWEKRLPCNILVH